jgi:hypothetical protein
MLLAMCATGLFAVFARVRCMTVRGIGVVPRLFMIVALLMLCRLHVMASCMRMVFRSLAMMVSSVLRHRALLLDRVAPRDAIFKVHGQWKAQMTVPIG